MASRTAASARLRISFALPCTSSNAFCCVVVSPFSLSIVSISCRSLWFAVFRVDVCASNSACSWSFRRLWSFFAA